MKTDDPANDVACASELPDTSYQVKRGCDDDETGDEMAQFLEILSAEARAGERDDEQVLLEAGD
jgi:hypothetical protein